MFQYEAYVSENTAGAKVMDITIVDQDERGTPGWHATLNIIKGNEDGAFKIETNQDSNVGTLCIQKVFGNEKLRSNSIMGSNPHLINRKRARNDTSDPLWLNCNLLTLICTVGPHYPWGTCRIPCR